MPLLPPVFAELNMNLVSFGNLRVVGGNLITLPFGYGKHYIALCGAALGAEHFVRILSGSSLAFVPTV